MRLMGLFVTLRFLSNVQCYKSWVKMRFLFQKPHNRCATLRTQHHTLYYSTSSEKHQQEISDQKPTAFYWNLESTKKIDSSQNVKIKAAKKLHSSHGRSRSGNILLEGHRLCCDVIELMLKHDREIASSSNLDKTTQVHSAVQHETKTNVELTDSDLIDIRVREGVEDNKNEIINELNNSDTQLSGLASLQVFIEESAFDAPEGRKLRELLQRLHHHSVVVISKSVSSHLSATKSPQGVYVSLKKPLVPWNYHSKLILILDSIRDPGNFGSLIRSACLFGCGGIISVNSCDVFNQKVLRASMGTCFQIPIVSLPDWVNVSTFLSQPPHNLLKEEEVRGNVPVNIYAADAGGCILYHEVDWSSGRNALVVGGEAFGLSSHVRKAIDSGDMKVISIPLASHSHSHSLGDDKAVKNKNQADSLNAAIAGSIVLCEANRQITK